MYQLETKSYFEILNTNIQKSKERLDRYLKDPSEENIHDVRTSIRRMEAAYSVLPRKIRQKRTVSEFMVSYRKFFKANSRIRDYDIILQRLDSMSVPTDEIKKSVQKMKKHELRLARKQAKLASKLKQPKLTLDTTLQSKLEKRFRKITIRLVERIQRLIPVVVDNKQNVDELHELRKDCKKLRYLMELSTSESADFVRKLRQMQDLLGTIHDIDITMDFVSKCVKAQNAKEVLKIESEKRARLYDDFVNTYHKSDTENQVH